MAKEKSEKDAKGKDAKHDKGAKAGGKPPAADAKPAAKPAKDAKKEGKAAKPTAKEAAPTQPPRLQVQYRETIVPALMKQFGYKTRMQVPRVTKITLNMGVGEAVADKKILENASADLQKIAGQKPVVTKSRKSIAAFKIRSGYPVGCMVTLRNRRMYEFLDRRQPRQLQHGHQGTDHFSGDRLRQDRRAPGLEYLHHHHREDRRGSEGAPRRVPVSVQN